MLDSMSYLAGLVDGEGSVGFYSKGRGQKNFCIEIKMTEESIIDWLVNEYGGTKQFRPSKNENWKDQYRWRVQGKAAERLYVELKPYLKIKNTI